MLSQSKAAHSLRDELQVQFKGNFLPRYTPVRHRGHYAKYACLCSIQSTPPQTLHKSSVMWKKYSCGTWFHKLWLITKKFTKKIPKNFRATEVQKEPRQIAKHICHSQSAPKILFCAGCMWWHKHRFIFFIAQPKPTDQIYPLTQTKPINLLNAEWSPYIKVNTMSIL